MARVSNSSLDHSTHHVQGPFSDVVNSFYNEKHVRRIDICCNMAVGLVCLAIVVAMIALTSMIHSQNGWILKMVPAYCICGALALIGAFTGIVAFKWMIEGIKRRLEFKKDVNSTNAS